MAESTQSAGHEPNRPNVSGCFDTSGHVFVRRTTKMIFHSLKIWLLMPQAQLPLVVLRDEKRSLLQGSDRT